MEKSKWHIVNDKNIFYNKHKDSLSKPLPLPGPREAAFNHEGGNSYEKEKHFESPCGQHAAGGWSITAWAAELTTPDTEGNITYVKTEPITTSSMEIFNPGQALSGETSINNIKIQSEFKMNPQSLSFGTYAVTLLDISGGNDAVYNVNGNMYIDVSVGATDTSKGSLSGMNANGIYVNGIDYKTYGNVFLKVIGEYQPDASSFNTIHSNAIQVNAHNMGGYSKEPGAVILNADKESDKVIRIIGGIEVETLPGAEKQNEASIYAANNSSYWYGMGSEGQSNIAIDFSNGAKWVPTDYDSDRDGTGEKTASIGTVNLHDGGIIDISKYNMDDAPEEALAEGVPVRNGEIERTANTNHEVSITNLSGNGGIFRMDLDYRDSDVKAYTESANTTSDWLDIGTGDAGTQYIDFNEADAGLTDMNTGNKIYFSNVNKEGENGAVAYDTVRHMYNTAGSFYNYYYGTGSEANASSGTDWYVELTAKDPDSNPNTKAAKGMLFSGYALGTEMDRLNKRLGEARYFEGDEGLWVRYRHNRTGWDNTFETDSDMIQIGYDEKVEEKDGRHYRGLALDYTDADTSIDGVSGEGDQERYALSLYDTWLGDKGHYRDIVLRGGRINSDFDLTGYFSDGPADIGGKYHQWFGSLSAEYGRKKDIGNDWYFEPQAQLQFAYVDGADYRTKSGIHVDIDDAKSLAGRLGFRIGKEDMKDDGTKNNYYFKADVLHEFLGDRSFSMASQYGFYDREYDGSDTWYDVGVGADISIDEDTFFWLDLEKVLGSDFDDTWEVNVGLRWEW